MPGPRAGGGKPQPPKGRVIPFGKYLLLERLAVGGMAEVFLAKSFGIAGFERIITIKRILPTMAEDDDFIEMFIDEAKIAGHLNHASIVPIYELGKIGESHYIAMEHVWGKDLLQIINRFRRFRRRMPPNMAAYIASRMCEALEYAHTKRDRQGEPLNIVHRDISPQNILVSYEGAVKLIDFGIAKAAGRSTKTQGGVLKGKFGYMSPEQVRGLPIDHRSDVFAVGTCIYEMLAADRLFLGESDFSTLEKVRHALVAPLNEVVSKVPEELESIVMKALRQDPIDRWQSAGELHEALQGFLSRHPPLFTAAKLAEWMKKGFEKELHEEKTRLDSFTHVSRPTGANSHVSGPWSERPERPTNRPPARVKPPPAVSKGVEEATQRESLGINEDDDSTTVSAEPYVSAEDLEADSTTIFFSSDDMEETEPEKSSGDQKVQVFSTGKAKPETERPIRTGAPGMPPPVIRIATERMKSGVPVIRDKSKPPVDFDRTLDERSLKQKLEAPSPPAVNFDRTLDERSLKQKLEAPSAPAVDFDRTIDERAFKEKHPTVDFDRTIDERAFKEKHPTVDFDRTIDERAFKEKHPTVDFDRTLDETAFRKQNQQSESAGGNDFKPIASPETLQETEHLKASGLSDDELRKKKERLLGLIFVVVMVVVALAFLLRGEDVSTGLIEVRTVPNVRAQVFVDGVDRGTSPTRIPGVPVGGHVIRVVADGYQVIERRVEVGADSTAMLDILLVAEDSRSVGMNMRGPTPETTNAMNGMQEGPVENMGVTSQMQEQEQPVSAMNSPSTMTTVSMQTTESNNSNEQSSMMATKRPSRGRGTLVINSQPWSQIFVDGRRRGNTPQPSLRVPAGQHRIRLRASDGRTYEETVTVRNGGTVRIIHSF